MKSTLIQIGNSKGIRIPKSMLEQCNLKKDIELIIQKNAIVIKPLNQKRKGLKIEAFPLEIISH